MVDKHGLGEVLQCMRLQNRLSVSLFTPAYMHMSHILRTPQHGNG